jgi:hypothetical protein
MIFSKRASTIADDNEQFDRSGLLRFGAWGCAAVVAVTTVVFAGRTELGAKRFNVAYAAITASPSDPPPAIVGQLLARTADMERDSRRLSETVRSLTNERERLTLRLGLVEREMGDLTGSITRGLSGMGKPADAKNTAPAGAPATPAIAPPVIAAPTTTAPAAPEPKTAEPKSARSSQTAAPPLAALSEPPPPAARPAQPAEPAPTTTSSLPETVPLPTPRPSDQSTQAAGTPSTNTIPLGAIRNAAATPVPATDPAATSPQPLASVAALSQTPAPTAPAQARSEAKPEGDEPQPRVEIGLDLGPALTIARLRQRWSAFKAAHGALADSMRPVISLREVAQNKPAEMRLVVGPVNDVHVATQLCAALQGSQFMCTPAVFDGQRLAQK